VEEGKTQAVPPVYALGSLCNFKKLPGGPIAYSKVSASMSRGLALFPKITNDPILIIIHRSFLMFQRLAVPAVLGGIALLPVHATSQELTTLAVPAFHIPTAHALSPECRTTRFTQDKALPPLKSLSRAVRSKPHVNVLAIGSSSTVGLGASSPTATYVARLEPTLEGVLKGIDFDVIGRGMSGEEAQGAADRMRKEVEDAKPDLVVWQVGTNDALRHVDLDRFKNCLRTTLAWLSGMGIDVVLINPQYGESLVKDLYYEHVVAAIAEVARNAGVLLVDRFDAMRELQKERGDLFYLAADSLHMNDVGYRCMAEQLAQAVVGGLVQADADQNQPVFGP
jgi:acyl-CoA thioesterase-1